MEEFGLEKMLRLRIAELEAELANCQEHNDALTELVIKLDGGTLLDEIRN